METVLVVDDEPLALSDLVHVIKEAGVQQEPVGFGLPSKALAWAQKNRVDIAFLDIEMPGMSGLDLARALKLMWPEVRIIFVTSYEHYAVKAFEVRATGYLLKPAHVEDVRRELTFIYGETNLRDGILYAHMFDGFEAKVNGAPLAFKRSKSKELLALLIDRRGMSLTGREARALLWEDEPSSLSQASYYQTIVADLRLTLAEAGVSDVLVRTRGRLAINPERVDADSWRALDGNPVALNGCSGVYLPAYAWAEGRFWTFEP